VKSTRFNSAWISFAVLLLVLWFEARSSAMGRSLGAHLPYAFASFALLLAPLWLLGFGAGEWLRSSIRSPVTRIILPSLLAVPYFVFAFPTHNFRWLPAIAMLVLPPLLAAFLESFKPPSRISWQDIVVLGVLLATYSLRLLASAWPDPGLAALPKLFVADSVLYLYLVVRGLEGCGYSLRPNVYALLIGWREWVYFLPFGIGLGAALSFIHFHPGWPSLAKVVTAVLITFLLVAIPEELFFRGILQNLLETRLGRTPALIVASILFGLAHFNKGAIFNWRYVILAAIAGVFYGRAWRSRRQLLASIITHTAVDVVWSLWFR
jgi:membrane protease YdiL (CAAX protease family)